MRLQCFLGHVLATEFAEELDVGTKYIKTREGGTVLLYFPPEKSNIQDAGTDVRGLL